MLYLSYDNRIEMNERVKPKRFGSDTQNKILKCFEERPESLLLDYKRKWRNETAKYNDYESNWIRARFHFSH